jgi:hypothetical protein
LTQRSAVSCSTGSEGPAIDFIWTLVLNSSRTLVRVVDAFARSSSMPAYLFEAFQLSDLTLANRIVMAPVMIAMPTGARPETIGEPLEQ